MSTSRQLARRAARAFIAEFLAGQVLVDHPSTEREICFDHISDLDLPFSDFWQTEDEEHGATCSERPVHGNCAECDALPLIRPDQDGVSGELHRRLLEMGGFDAFGKMTLPVSLMRPSRAV